MFPENVTEILQQLSYLSLIIICPCVVYTTIKAIVLELTLNNHIQSDERRFTQITDHIGKHYSNINDLQMDVSALMSLRNNGNGK